jgi:hypothetical protein
MLRALVTVSLAATAAHADPSNVDVAVRCGHYLATVEDGLQLRIDGVPQLGATEYVKPHLADPDATLRYYEDVAGVGFTVAPGRHHLELVTPDCAPIARDVLIVSDAPTMIEGRLAVVNPRLRGTVGAPDHLGLIAGVSYGAAPATSGTDADTASSWTASSERPKGGWLALTFERRYLAAAFDGDIGATSVSGTTTNIDPQRAPASSTYTQTGWYMRWDGRVGARLALDDVALAAGTGLGLELGMPAHAALEMPTTEELTAREWWRGFFVPVWISVTYKPVCNFGVVALASYDVHPLTISSDAVSIGLGVTYQPSSACSEPAGLTVSE